MNRGAHFPRARSKWISGRETANLQFAPVWMKVSALISFFLYPVEDPLGLPVPVGPEDCSFARWNYAPDLPGIVYDGTWANVWGSGLWRFIIENREPESLRVTAAIVYGSFVGGGFTARDSGTDYVASDWGALHGPGEKAVWFVENDYPWVFMDMACNYVSYAELRAHGIDQNDTAPGSWNYIP